LFPFFLFFLLWSALENLNMSLDFPDEKELILSSVVFSHSKRELKRRFKFVCLTHHCQLLGALKKAKRELDLFFLVMEEIEP
jgi:hypothetical protein